MGGKGSLIHMGSEHWPLWCDPRDEPLLLKLLKKLKLVLVDRFQNTQYITVCCVWGCRATDQSGWQCWPLTPVESTNNGHVSIRTGPQGHEKSWPGLMNYVFFYIMWMARCVCIAYLWEHMAPGCTMGRRQAGGGSVIFWAMFCWETLRPAILVDVTLTLTTWTCCYHLGTRYHSTNSESNIVHASVGQGCFGSKKWTNTTLGRWS